MGMASVSFSAWPCTVGSFHWVWVCLSSAQPPRCPSPANPRVSFPQPEVGPRRPRLLSVCCHLPLTTDLPGVLSWPTLSPVSPQLTAPRFCPWPHWLHPLASLFLLLPSLFCGEHPDLTHILQQQETNLRVWELAGAPEAPGESNCNLCRGQERVCSLPSCPQLLPFLTPRLLGPSGCGTLRPMLSPCSRQAECCLPECSTAQLLGCDPAAQQACPSCWEVGPPGGP